MDFNRFPAQELLLNLVITDLVIIMIFVYGGVGRGVSAFISVIAISFKFSCPITYMNLKPRAAIRLQ